MLVRLAVWEKIVHFFDAITTVPSSTIYRIRTSTHTRAYFPPPWVSFVRLWCIVDDDMGRDRGSRSFLHHHSYWHCTFSFHHQLAYRVCRSCTFSRRKIHLTFLSMGRALTHVVFPLVIFRPWNFPLKYTFSLQDVTTTTTTTKKTATRKKVGTIDKRTR